VALFELISNLVARDTKGKSKTPAINPPTEEPLKLIVSFPTKIKS